MQISEPSADTYQNDMITSKLMNTNMLNCAKA